ncbi:CcdB family protein [Enterobacter mori]|uniref:CcdB family protein n=1 Tax=Enterobacter mori TaxID=539813 RepID=UPI000E7471B6|nr:hypothetical protein D5265_022595 [Enterobacter mori]
MKTAPLVTFRGLSDEAIFCLMHMMAGISPKELGERVADLTQNRALLRDALDFLINGY